MRNVLRITDEREPHWVGDGFHVRSVFSYDDDPAETSPFLLLDWGAPRVFAPTEKPGGVGQHPHRGFETVTIAFQGEVEHRDSAGNAGRIGPGDVQWMTAASGVLHQEFHGREFAKRGGVFEVAQIWVNLPARLKMAPPRYQDIVASSIPVATLPGGTGEVRVISGEFLGVQGPAKTFTPVEIWTARIAAGREAEIALPEGHTALALAMHGDVVLNGKDRLPEGRLAVFGRTGGAFRAAAATEAKLLVLGGEPIDEPVVGYGPFVMNTDAEIAQAMRDFQLGRFGRMR